MAQDDGEGGNPASEGSASVPLDHWCWRVPGHHRWHHCPPGPTRPRTLALGGTDRFGTAEVWYAVHRFRSKTYRMDGDNNQRSTDGRVMAITLVGVLVAVGAQDRGASVWMMLVIAGAVGGILTVLVELAVRTLHHRPGAWALTPGSPVHGSSTLCQLRPPSSVEIRIQDCQQSLLKARHPPRCERAQAF